MRDTNPAVTATSVVDLRAASLVVPLDGTSDATAALPVARELALIEGATLHIVHVSAEHLTTADMAAHLRLGPEHLAGTVLDARTGPPAQGIVDLARDLGSRLIVMSTRTGRVPEQGALGDVTREVLRRTPCPVVLVSPDRAAAPWTIRQILLPHDGIPTTAAAIARAADLAARAHAELAVLHIASTGPPRAGERGGFATPRYLDQPQHEWPNWAREFMDRLTALGGPPPNARMRLFFAAGDPAHAIAEFVAEHHTDLIAIAWVPGWEPERRTTMRQVIEHAPAPLLIFPSEEPERGMVF